MAWSGSNESPAADGNVGGIRPGSAPSLGWVVDELAAGRHRRGTYRRDRKCGLLCGEQHYQFVRLTAGAKRIQTLAPAGERKLCCPAMRAERLEDIVHA